ncbi:hypothetical protein BCR42DRAFT_422687 [Absidia repens]|uniref:Transmembrane protein n=1 Tax=Absidia repens TaxID=90262 RepID=A0A1X2H966_9FUNG|nr:hypothetical protein BCR42DRAFT_430628 [Absidia repens]ORZ10572.1 hypothetical protein BCR42DRAFT_422687 [Absidia repens]
MSNQFAYTSPNQQDLSSVSKMDLNDDAALKKEKEAVNKKEYRAALFRQIRTFAVLLIVDIGLPLALYYILKNYISQLLALVLSGIPPLLHVIISFIIKRRIEVIGCICIFSFVLSGILTLVSGDARLALLRDSTTSAVIALFFLVTLIPLETRWFKLYPLTFLVVQQMLDNILSLNRPEFYWTYMPDFRRHNFIYTALWGSTLMLEFIIKVILIEATTLSVDIIMLSGTIVVAVLFITVTATVTYMSHRLRKRCAAFSEQWIRENDYSSDYPSQESHGNETIV